MDKFNLRKYLAESKLYENNTVSVYIEDEGEEVDIDITGATKNQKGLIDYAIEIEEFPSIDDVYGMFGQLMDINSEEDVAYYYEFERGWGKEQEDDWKLAMLAFRDGKVLDSHEPDQVDEGKLVKEAKMVRVDADEIMMHINQYQRGNIDGDDLAQAIEEIVVGEVSAPGKTYGR